MVGEQLWEALQRAADEGLSIRALARRFELDRKTVRQCLKGGEWRP
jgi:DNA-binding IclR family transcriptional regulator